MRLLSVHLGHHNVEDNETNWLLIIGGALVLIGTVWTLRGAPAESNDSESSDRQAGNGEGPLESEIGASGRDRYPMRPLAHRQPATDSEARPS